MGRGRRFERGKSRHNKGTEGSCFSTQETMNPFPGWAFCVALRGKGKNNYGSFFDFAVRRKSEPLNSRKTTPPRRKFVVRPS